MNLRKGISPVIATVIIVAVALAIAIAVVGWIMGIWGAVAGGTELLRIMPDSKLYSTADGTAIVALHVKNEGGATAVITKVEIVGVGSDVTFTYDTGGGTTSVSPLSISAGTDMYFNVTVSKSISAGAIYTIKVYTSAGNVYTTQLVAETA